MGGFGSGSWRPGRSKVREVLWLDVQRLKPALASQVIQGSWTESWTRGEEPSGKIGCTLLRGSTGPALRLDYTVTPLDGEPQNVSYRIDLESTPCHYGGVRWWFRCPASGCNRRCRFLHLAGSYFACRQCANLTYESSQSHRDLGTEWRLVDERVEKVYGQFSRARSPRRRRHLAKRLEKLQRRQEGTWGAVAGRFNIPWPPK